MQRPSRILLLAVYGMEVVECGGALAKHAQQGGKSFAHVLLSRERSRPDVLAAAKHLGVEVSFGDFRSGELEADVRSKKALVKVIRETRPDLVITQDPEHSFHDLDPDRRPAMILILESLALASRDFALDEMPGLAPVSIPTIYYMTPHHPNCVVDVSDVWALKEQAMDELRNQMNFSGQMFPQLYRDEHLRAMVPGWENLQDDYRRGREAHRVLDMVTHLHNGAGSHGRFAFAEAYRREGKFHLDDLVL
ncbi:MAG: PIG-L family deacetylase [Trueperaceae bacterium]|nr:PIG-L family deacetylase [Trueperaceae bacterium]